MIAERQQPYLLPETDGPPVADGPMPGAYDKATDLTPADVALLDRVIANLNLLADLSHADLMLYTRSAGEAVIVAQAQPTPVPSMYTSSQVGRRVTRSEAPSVFSVLYGGRRWHAVKGLMIRGAPAIQEVFPIINSQGEVVAALSSEIALLEHERQRDKSPIYRRAIARVRELVLTGRLEGGHRIGRLGVHDGPMVIDARGRIRYISAIAEHLYRRLGYADSLVNTNLSELDTNEYICFKAMEQNECMEQRVQEQDHVWVKKVIPLAPSDADGWFSRLFSRSNQADGALIVIQDITDEVRKEQELKIKSAMIQEIHHRVKNNLQTIAALLRLQARRCSSPEAISLLRQTVNRILSIAVVHEFLSKDETSVINIHEVCNRIVQEVTHGVLDPEKGLRLVLEGSSFYLPTQQATSCALIINELLQNAVEHGYTDRSDGTIRVRLVEESDSLRIEIQDDGRGLPPGFDLASQGGLGLQIVQTLVREDLKGQFVMENGHGVKAVVSFPRWLVQRSSATSQ